MCNHANVPAHLRDCCRWQCRVCFERTRARGAVGQATGLPRDRQGMPPEANRQRAAYYELYRSLEHRYAKEQFSGDRYVMGEV